MALALSEEGGVLVAEGEDGDRRAWDLATGMARQDRHAPIAAQAVALRGALVASGRMDGSVSYGDLGGGALSTFPGHDDWLTGVAFVGQDRLATASLDGSLR